MKKSCKNCRRRGSRITWPQKDKSEKCKNYIPIIIYTFKK